MKHAIILGASGDIGQACAETLAEQGWSLYCHYNHNQEVVESLTNRLREKYPKQDFFMLHFDMTKELDVSEMQNNIFQADAVVFASGSTVYKLLTETTSEEMDNLWKVFIKSPIQICQQLQSKLASKQDGRIVFIGSVYGMAGSSMEVVYSTLKGAQQAFAKAYAQEVASLGITVNVVAPGAVDTKMNQDWTKEEREGLISEIPVHRMAEPKEIASVVQFLLSDNAKYITGTTIPISGGWKV